MSTKKKLIEATKRLVLSVPYTIKSGQVVKNVIDYTEDYRTVVDDIAKLQVELFLKKNTLITKETLLKNGFEVHPPFHGYYVLRTPEVNLEVEWDKDGCYWSDAILRNVADLEDALDLCGIDKEIEL